MTLGKKSPSERFWFQSWVSFRGLNLFFLIFTPFFGRKTFNELWLIFCEANLFQISVGGLSFQKKTSRSVLCLSRRINYPIGGFLIESFPTKSKMPGLPNET